MKQNERICVCGKIYKYCPHCPDRDKVEYWRLRWCSENCRNIDKILCDYGANLIDIKTARNKLLQCDCTEIDNWRDSYKNMYYSIMNTKKAVKKRSETTEKIETVAYEII